ncbi:putative yhr209w-like protein [Diaporthe ampelina]|uniref:Putative yhr209w-like protein n=1 Tax=Diaporthe ampelina TaxID=1214573 RepID=A0A0G2FQS0_9PEZI|nr:putative yhr209w-like protein [Diaporthe ampelina]
MILSDPSESNVTTAKELLKAEEYPGTSLSFHQKKGEDSFLEPGSVDMVIACECLHFTDAERAIASIHASLRPGGTVASVFYGVLNSRIPDNERASAAWKAFGLMHFRRVVDENIETVLARVNVSQVAQGLNFVPLDRGLWRDVRRVFVNIPEGQTEWPMEVGMPEGARLKGRSRLDPEYDGLEWRRDPDGWAIRNCTTERIKEMMVSMLLQYGDKDWQSDEWREFEVAVSEGGGTFHFVFPATMILARKK